MGQHLHPACDDLTLCGRNPQKEDDMNTTINDTNSNTGEITPDIDFASIAMDHAASVLTTFSSGGSRESPSKKMIVDAAVIQQLSRIADALENIETILLGTRNGTE